MDLIFQFLDFFLHLDNHLHSLIINYGAWIYAILFLIIFVETGLVVMPFLPGDSLLFAAGAFCAGIVKDGAPAQLNLFLVLILLVIAAILGDALNYFIGKKIGLRVLQYKMGKSQLVNQKYIDKTQLFYEKHGSKTIIMARFIPIIRTFAPFVAGIAQMKYTQFLQYNIIGALIWVLGLTLLGYFFGTLPFVQNNFELVIFGIIGISLVPVLIELIKSRRSTSS
jgi:membrane-associated protein